MERAPKRTRDLRWILRGLAQLNPAPQPSDIAILVDDRGYLEARLRQGDPNFITVAQANNGRTLHTTYIKTGLRCQGGYYVYTLYDVNCADKDVEELLHALGKANERIDYDPT